MSHFCPYCNAEMADDSAQCPHCGQPPTADSLQEQQAESDRRFPFWTILPWTLLAAAALFFLPHMLRSGQAESAVASQPFAAHAPSASAAPALPAVSDPVVSAPVAVASAAVPLTVTLSTASGSRHVPVGKPVMISAYASLPPGQSATLAISYGKDGDPKTLLALAQGSLSSAAWTPTEPGRYRFTASALDSRKNGAFSHHLTIFAEAAPASVAGKPAPVITEATPRRSKRTSAKTSAPKPPIKVAAAPKPRVPAAAHPQPYHVAAATFPFKRIAETLAGALRQRGFHASVRSDANGGYRVETGDFVRRSDADKQVQLLKRDGYPSYLFQTH